MYCFLFAKLAQKQIGRKKEGGKKERRRGGKEEWKKEKAGHFVT